MGMKPQLYCGRTPIISLFLSDKSRALSRKVSLFTNLASVVLVFSFALAGFRRWTQAPGHPPERFSSYAGSPR